MSRSFKRHSGDNEPDTWLPCEPPVETERWAPQGLGGNGGRSAALRRHQPLCHQGTCEAQRRGQAAPTAPEQDGDGCSSPVEGCSHLPREPTAETGFQSEGRRERRRRFLGFPRIAETQDSPAQV